MKALECCGFQTNQPPRVVSGPVADCPGLEERTLADLAEWTNPGSYASISTGESHLVDECMPAWVTMQIVEQRVLFHLTQFRSILLVRAF